MTGDFLETFYENPTSIGENISLVMKQSFEVRLSGSDGGDVSILTGDRVKCSRVRDKSPWLDYPGQVCCDRVSCDGCGVTQCPVISGDCK